MEAGLATIPSKMNFLGGDTVISLAVRLLFPFLRIKRPPRILGLILTNDKSNTINWWLDVKTERDGEMCVMYYYMKKGKGRLHSVCN